jgi:hypothetical protein
LKWLLQSGNSSNHTGNPLFFKHQTKAPVENHTLLTPFIVAVHKSQKTSVPLLPSCMADVAITPKSEGTQHEPF